MLHKSALLGALALSSLDDIAAYNLLPSDQEQLQAKKNKAVLEAITGYVGNQIVQGKPLIAPKLGEDGMFHQPPPEGPIQSQVTGVKVPKPNNVEELPGDEATPVHVRATPMNLFGALRPSQMDHLTEPLFDNGNGYTSGIPPKPITPGNGVGRFVMGSGINQYSGTHHDGTFESMIASLSNENREIPYQQFKTADSHTHTHTFEDKTCVLDINKLIELSKHLPVLKARLDQLKGIDRSKRTGFSEKRLAATDTQYPLLVHKDTVVDGRHRAIKLKEQGEHEANIRRITEHLMNKARIS